MWKGTFLHAKNRREGIFIIRDKEFRGEKAV